MSFIDYEDPFSENNNIKNFYLFICLLDMFLQPVVDLFHGFDD